MTGFTLDPKLQELSEMHKSLESKLSSISEAIKKSKPDAISKEATALMSDQNKQERVSKSD